MPTTRLPSRPIERPLKLPIWSLALAAVLFMPSPPCVSAQGILQGLRDDVRRPEPPSTKPDWEDDRHDHHRHDDCWCDCDDDDNQSLGEVIGWLTLEAVTSPFWVPRGMVGDDTFDPGYFARYPYRSDLDGYMAIDPWTMENLHPWLADDHYSWLVRARAEYADDFNDLSRIGGQVLLDSASRWGLDTEFNYRREDLGPSLYDSLWTGDCNLVYRFAQSSRVQMRSGVGFNWLSDTAGSDFGFNFTYGADWFPHQPWIVSAEIDWGQLGSATLFHGRTTIGVHLRRLEVYTGYDYDDVGGTHIQGLISGLRIWY
jgi:hypothetical protein